MTPEEFEVKMAQIFDEGDTEEAHENADALMCEVLKSLGYGEGVEIFEEMPKWYA